MKTSSFFRLPVAVLATGGVSTEERLARLQKLDFTQLRRKLQQPIPEGLGWNEEQALEAEKWYKRYLASIIQYPSPTKHVPNAPIDAFWHQHILDTERYGPDCEYVLGYFLHHYPYYGLNGDSNARNTSFEETNAIYRELFGEDCTKMDAFMRTESLGSSERTLVGMSCNNKGGQGCSKK